MNFTIFETPEKDAGTACWDYFSNEDENLENYAGLAVGEDIEVTFAMLHYLGHRVHKKIPTPVVPTDSEIVLLIEKKHWKNPQIRAAWSEIVATSKEELFRSANLHSDGSLIENICERWANRDIADRVGELRFLEVQDLSQAILDDLSEELVHSLIDGQVKHLLD
jgi:hypothetical protein